VPASSVPPAAAAFAAAAVLASRKADPGVGGRLARPLAAAAMAASSSPPASPSLAGQSPSHCSCQAAPLTCLGVVDVLAPEAPTSKELLSFVAAEPVSATDVTTGRSGHEEAPWELV
jgi:hypothetical protein